MGLQETKIESLPFVKAELNYLAPIAGKPRTYAFDPPPGEPKSTALPEPHVLPIFDGRLIAKNFSLDREGFALTHHDTGVTDFYDERQVREIYYPEMERLVAEKTGAEKVIVFDHTIRTAERAVERGLRSPVQMVHNDYTDKSGPQRVRDLLPAGGRGAAQASLRRDQRMAADQRSRPRLALGARGSLEHRAR